jgi:hypothetical protein
MISPTISLSIVLALGWQIFLRASAQVIDIFVEKFFRVPMGILRSKTQS